MTATTADGGNWLDVPVTAGTAPSMVTVGITPASLPGGGATAGTYVGQLLFAATGSSVTVPVSVTVGSNVFTQVNPLNFTMPLGGGALPQVLSIASPGTNFTFSSAVYTGDRRQLAEHLQPGRRVLQHAAWPYGERQRLHTCSGNLCRRDRSDAIFPATPGDDRAGYFDHRRPPGTTFFDSVPGELSFFRTTTETRRRRPSRSGTVEPERCIGPLRPARRMVAIG